MTESHSVTSAFTDAQLADIVRLRREEKTYVYIAKYFKRTYGIDKFEASYRHAYETYADLFEVGSEKFDADRLKEVARTKRLSSKNARNAKRALDLIINQEDILVHIKEAIESIGDRRLPKLPKPKRHRKNPPMTMELMLSDLHFGKLTDTFNNEVATQRIKDLTDAVLWELKKNEDEFNVDHLIIAMLGDFIENSTMHGVESAKGCEFSTAKQVQEAITILFVHLLLPLGQTALPITIPCVTGNHDRDGVKVTFHNPGESNWTWVIYNTLQMLCEAYSLTNIEFIIPKGSSVVLNVYGDNVLYEHGDNVKAPTPQSFEKLMADRGVQFGKIIKFGRFGHWHEYRVFGRGKIIINESLPGNDSYAEVKGYDSHAGQTINYYIDPQGKRPSAFFKTFPVYLR